MEVLKDLALVDGGTLTVDAVYDGTVIRLRFVGEGRTPEAIAMLEPFFDAVHATALRLAVQTVIVDVKQLEYMNSSCFKGFLTWIDGVRQLEPEQQYRIRFASNPAFPWQGRTLKSLQRFAAELVSLD